MPGRRAAAPALAPGLTRRGVLVLPLALGVLAAGAQRRAQAATLPAPESLARALDEALRQRRPLVLMASLHGCPFCQVARDHYLAPLREAGQPVVQIDMSDPRPLRDFADAPTTHGKLLRDWGVKVAPTVLFFGRGGREVAERLVGASLPDFYGAYLDERLAKARAALG